MTTTVVKKFAFALLGVAAAVALGLPASSEAQTAQARFNDVSNARPTVSVSNHTNNPGCTTCWTSSVSAKPGDVISVDVAYLNTAWDTNTTALNTMVTLDHSATATGFTIRGAVDASNSNPATGSVTVTIPSTYKNVSLKPLSADWYVAGVRKTPSANGPASYSIGSVKPGYNDAGDIVVRFQVMGDSTGGGGTCQVPAASTGGATNVGQNSATLNGSYLGTATQSWFEFGTTASLGYKIAAANGMGQATGLLPGKTYYYKYVAQNDCGRTEGTVKSFTTAGQQNVCEAPLASTGGATNVGRNVATISGSVNYNSQSGGSHYFVYGTVFNALTFQTSMQSGSGGVTAGLSNLSPGTTYYYKLIAKNNCGKTTEGAVQSFTTDEAAVVNPPASCTAPTAQTFSAQGVSSNSAVVSGSASNAGSTWFEYGTSPTSLPNRINGTGGAATLSGLANNTTYYFRYVAQNSCNTARGQVLNFTTGTGGAQCVAPTASASSASAIGQNSAVLSGSVNANGQSRNYWIAYGTDPNNLNLTAGSQSTSGNQSLSVPVSGLTANTVYYYQVVIQGCNGEVRSNTVSFTTGSAGGQCQAPTVSIGGATNIGQNSAVLSGSVNPNNAATTYWFQYGTDSNLGYVSQNQTLAAGSGTQNISMTIGGLSSNTTYYFRIVAQNSCGQTNGQTILNFQTGNNPTNNRAPDVTTLSATSLAQTSAVLNGQVDPNASDTTAWFEYGLSQFGLSYTTNSSQAGSGDSYQNFSQFVASLQPGTTYYYRAAARNAYGTAYGQVLSFTTPGTIISSIQQPTVITDPATGVGRTSALLNGRVNPNGGTTSAWFEYGQTASLGLATPQQPMGAGSDLYNYAFPVSGLLPSTTYYFRAVAQNQSGIVYGQILPFTTTGGTVTTGGGGTVFGVSQSPIIVTTVGGGGVGMSCLILTPTINQDMAPGTEFIYGITYRNDCPFDLQNATMRIFLPNEVDFSSTNFPFLSRDMNVITYNLGTVPRNFQATILVRGLVKPTVRLGDNLIFKSDLSFTDPQGRFQSVSAFLTAIAGQGVVLTASIFDTLLRFLSSGWFWLLLFLLLLAMFVLWLATRRRADDEEHAH